MSDLISQISGLCQQAKVASNQLANASTKQKDNALMLMAEQLRNHQEFIIAENKKDLEIASEKNLSKALLDRLTLNDTRIEAMANGLEAISKLEDPVGKVLYETSRPSSLHIQRVSVPLGVLAVIYESRPNVTADAASLCLKSGNAVILRGGSESANSSRAIVGCLHKGLEKAGLPIEVVQMVPTQDRKAVDVLIQQDEYIDVVIPRGGKGLISYLAEHSKIPLFKHLDGICHTYIHAQADPEKAIKVALNAKMRRTGICGATETILIDSSLSESILPKLIQELHQAGCEVRVEADIHNKFQETVLAVTEDWATEYLDSVVSIKIVNGIDEALEHINCYSSHHTDAIITEDESAAELFLNKVDSAIVMLNTSTQFADGGEFGMGAEIGISTGKLHARGPVGVEQLTTFKYKVKSNGSIRQP
ncbi:glutamate-5-semialdehyde dehydrogenase [Francisellaceae bacterium]|nr:glutamate-5-semialdehyde dehydrogenase [Francisellaceae bacterium]